MEALDTDVLLAMQANSKCAFIYALQRRTYVAQEVGFAVQVANRQFTFGRILDFIQGVRALLDRDPVPISQHLHQLSLFAFQAFFEFVYLVLPPRLPSPSFSSSPPFN